MQTFTGIPAPRIIPLGDSALLIEWGKQIDETLHRRVLALDLCLRQADVPGVTEWLPAYASLAIIYDPLILQRTDMPGATAFDKMKNQVEALLAKSESSAPITGKRLRIPVCYHPSMAPDLLSLAAQKNTSPEALAALHYETTYRVYLLGFLPGFAYMGSVPEALAAVRHPVPRQQVPAGSVGVAGRQTGIYPQAAPGGWQLIGRTPLTLFSAAENPPALLAPGDEITLYPITPDEFADYTLRPL